MATNGKAKQCSNNLTEDKEYNNTSKVAEDVTTKVLIPPDGGWGWVITFSSFMIGMIVDGIAFTFGFFFLEFQEYFGANKSVTSSINSVLAGSYFTIGPVVGALTNVFGCRKVAMVGAVITAVSFFLCTFSPNVETMIILYGLCGGTGFGMMYLPAIVMVGYYFDKRRALATGIAVCGSGIGSFVFAPLSESLLRQYSWKGAMWILSGLSLNGIVFAALFRPLEYESSTDMDAACDEEITIDQKVTTTGHNLALQRVKDDPSSLNRSRSVEGCNHVGKESEIARLGHSVERKDFYSGSIKNIPEYKEAGNEQRFVRKILNKDKTEEEFSKNGWTHFLRDTFDTSLMKSPTFVMYVASCFLCTIGFFVPFIYIPDIAMEHGMTSSQSAWIISSIGIINTVARIVVGWVSDKPWADSILINTAALILTGVITIFVPYYKIYPLYILYAVLFGFGIAVFVSLRSIIIVELLGIDKLTNSFGLLILCQGLSTFIGSPIAGALFDLTGNYMASFYLAGSVICISGLICLPLRRLSRWEKARNERKKERANMADVEKPLVNGN
ncbi:hypothetical protein ACF0H5_012096 [Mactra antiquata]